jgi:hypothetical protein
MAVLDWAPDVHAAWEALTDEERDDQGPFDWEFVPAWITERTDWSDPQYLPTLKSAA